MWLRRGTFGTLVLITLLIVIVSLEATRVRLPGEEVVPAGSRRNVALYVPMRDGTQIAVDVWLPPNLAAGERVPVLLSTTRYWRAVQYTRTFRAIVALHYGAFSATSKRSSIEDAAHAPGLAEAGTFGAAAARRRRYSEPSPAIRPPPKK